MTESAQVYHDYLTELGVFSGELPDILLKAVGSISTNATPKMKVLMAMSELVLFASNLRKPIHLYNEVIMPVNSISFLLSASGTAKDSSLNAIRGAMAPAYASIEKYRKEHAIELAKAKAVTAGKEEDDWREFYSSPRDLFPALSNQAAMLKHFAALEAGKWGAGSINVSEIGTALQSNKNFTEMVDSLSIGYDLGKIPSVLLKDDANQTPSIKGLPINALLFGSADLILYDEKVREKFKLELSSKLSRRGTICYEDTVIARTVIKTKEDIKAKRKATKDARTRANNFKLELSPIFQDLVETTTTVPLIMPEDTQELYDDYLAYNDELAADMTKLHPLSILSRGHAQWRALKLAGAWAILNGKDSISKQCLIYGISCVEYFMEDMAKFETAVELADYELFSKYMTAIAENGKSSISLHILIKLGYISKTGNSTTKMIELVKLASSYDPTGIYSVQESKIFYELIEKTDVIGASHLAIDNSGIQQAIRDHRPKSIIQEEKSKVAASALQGYVYDEAVFASLGNLLTTDLAFTPFQLIDGKRGKENTHGKIKWVCLDVDDSKITDEEAHIILSSLNHHIARTSDVDNPFKFRIILELDAAVEVPDKIWKYFLESLQDYLSINIDPISRSHIIFGYVGRNVLSVTDAFTLEAKEHLMFAHSAEASKPVQVELSAKQKEVALGTPMSTYAYAFEAGMGEGSRRLIQAAYHARKLGASNHDIELLIHEINDYWEYPMDLNRLETTILVQVRRF